MAAFLRRGGAISPGIVPSSEAVLSCSVEDMVGLWHRFGESVDALDPGAKWRDWFVTPSCGAGSLTPHAAERVLELLAAFEASSK